MARTKGKVYDRIYHAIANTTWKYHQHPYEYSQFAVRVWKDASPGECRTFGSSFTDDVDNTIRAFMLKANKDERYRTDSMLLCVDLAEHLVDELDLSDCEVLYNHQGVCVYDKSEWSGRSGHD